MILLPNITVSWTVFQKIRVLVYNQFGITVSALSASADDTIFQYYVETKDKIPKRNLPEVNWFIQGIIATMKSF